MKAIDILLPGFVAFISLVITWMTIREMPEKQGRRRSILIAVILLVAGTALVSCASAGLLPQLAFIFGRPSAEFLTRFILFIGITMTIAASCALPTWSVFFCSVACFSAVIFAEGLESTFGIIMSAALNMGVMADPVHAVLRMLISYGVTVGLYKTLFLSHIDGNRLGSIERTEMLFMVAVDLLVCIGFDFITASFIDINPPTPVALPVALKAALCAFCVLVVFAEYETLYRRHLAEDNLVLEHLLAEKARQYELSKQSIEAINERAHDLLHEFWSISRADGAKAEDYSRLIDELNIYDASIETGNQALDVALTEKSLLCKHAGIRLSCVADGHAVEHLSPADTYALFSSVLEDAIASVQRIPDTHARSINIVVKTQGSLASIHVGSSRARIGEDEGVSLRAAATVVERYDGTVSCSSGDGAFQFNALIPIPSI